MIDKPPVGLYLDTRRANKDNKFPVKVRITFEVYEAGKAKWIPQYVHTKQYLTEEQYKVIVGGNPKTPELRAAQATIYKVRARVQDIIDDTPRISIERFYREYEGNDAPTTYKQSTLADFFDQAIKEKAEEDCIGTALSYQDARKSILKFGGEDILVSTITPAWIKKYETYMLQTDHSLNTVGIYLRGLRRALKLAIKAGFLNDDDYPFGKDKYIIRKKRKKKKVVAPIIKNKIMSFEPRTDAQQKAWDYTMFSFLSNGMNMTDMAYLTRENFDDVSFSFVRRKSMNTAQEQKEITVFLNDILRDILKRRAIPGSHYIFGIITPQMDSETKKRKIKQWIRNNNKRMTTILKIIGIKDRITSYNWRHTFTTMLLNAGVPITKVMDSLGHMVVTTTQEYAEDLDFDTSKTFADILLKH